MLSRNQLKYLHSLRLGKFRDLHRAFLVEGVKMVDELIQSNYVIHTVYGLTAWQAARKHVLTQNNIDFQEITEDELSKASGLITPNEVIAVAQMPESELPPDEGLGKLVILLDRLQDPGNLGTMIRTADWFGIRNIVCSDGSVDVFNPKVVQATMGSVFRVNVFYTDLVGFIGDISTSRKVYATIAGGEPVHEARLELPAAVIIGNESNGISENILPLVKHKIGIPAVSGTAESLNASVAAGIICWEFIRRT